MSPEPGFLDDIETSATPRSKVDVEVILHKEQDDDFVVQLDENSRIRHIPRRGVKIFHQKGKIATLRLSEAKAVEYSLV